MAGHRVGAASMAGLVGARFILALLILMPLGLSTIPALALASEVYVVHLGAKYDDKHEAEVVLEHTTLLASVLGSTGAAEESILYHYHRTFRGFAAKMEASHAATLRESKIVLGVHKSLTHKPHTSYSWRYLGVLAPDSTDAVLPGGGGFAFPPPSVQTDIIIGVLDSGYWPESPSFQDVGMPPIPLGWKGACLPGQQFDNTTACNKKVIGAKHYYSGAQATMNGAPLQDLISARDTAGHGSHTASTAAGMRSDESYFGVGQGIVSGGASGARLAIYKVCFQPAGCNDADMLAAFDDAIADGVHIISISIGVRDPANPTDNTPFIGDSIAHGSYYAMLNNILVVASAGNDGPAANTVVNTAPWLLTVAASSMDRDFVTNVVLGDGTIIPGGASWVINPIIMPGPAPLLLASNAALFGTPPLIASICASFSLDPAIVTGAIVVCNVDPTTLIGAEAEVRRAGGVGIILIGAPVSTVEFVGPATFISQDAFNFALQTVYVQTTPLPFATILPTQASFGQVPAPRVAAFSSRGPSLRNPQINKPDITAPGVNILAAFSPLQLKAEETGGRPNVWNFMSGTSMATPHIAGIAALVKAAHPTWSPAAIKSAIMTTALQTDNTNSPITNNPFLDIAGPWDFGAGHVNPLRALDPGLVYDINVHDYDSFLCDFGFTDAQLQQYTQDPSATCPPIVVPQVNTNYPGISTGPVSIVPTVVTRYLTNVGPLDVVTYTSTVNTPVPPFAVLTTVDPPILAFSAVGETLPFTVTFTQVFPGDGIHAAWGSLTWSDGIHLVTIPLVTIPT